VTAAAVQVVGLTRRFGGVTAVDNVSFAVAPGEVFGLIGPNGAGKTTLFNLVTGFTPPSSGTLFHDGADITAARPHQVARRGIARTFQNIRLFAELSALENVMVGRHCQTKSGLFSGVLGFGAAGAEERAVRHRARELLHLTGLLQKQDVKARNLSYGDQRRLEIARALALDPRVLLLDEPAAGMNPSEKAALSDFIRRLRADFGLTMLIIEHHVPLVMGLCDRIGVLDFGRLIALGDPDTVRRDPAVVEAYLGEEA
jgi:branched-chain amino acid transport system ATP-binding protein